MEHELKLLELYLFHPSGRNINKAVEVIRDIKPDLEKRVDIVCSELRKGFDSFILYYKKKYINSKLRRYRNNKRNSRMYK